MITQIVTLRFKPGSGEEFAAAFPENAQRILSEEPGTLLYKLTQLRDEPDTYRVVEFYNSQAALDLRMANVRRSPSGIGELLAAPPAIETHDDV